MNKPNKSYVIIEDIKPEDWEFGSASFGKEVLVPDGDWRPHLPSNEKQHGLFESYACTNFSSTSTIETYFTYLIKKGKISVGNLQWLEDNGYFDKNGLINFSDRFDAIVSGTGPNGNTLKAPAEAKHKYGLIPEKMLPWTDDQTSYFDEKCITQEMYALGQEFLRRFPINYERVSRSNFEQALKYSPLAGAVYAWNGQRDGVFYRVENQINHAIEIIKPPSIWNIFDSYNPFIKQLADDYIFLNYAYRYIIQENITLEPKKNDMLKTLKAQTDARIFIQSNTHPKTLIWINDPDGTSWTDYKDMFLKHGLIMPAPKIIEDAVLASYKIEPFQIHGSYYKDDFANPFGKLFNWVKSLFYGK